MSMMNFSIEEQEHFDRALKDKSLRRQVWLYQLSKVVALGGVALGFALMPGLAFGFICLAAYGIFTLWETERFTGAVLTYRNVIKKLAASGEAVDSSAHDR
jgi:hypothetical protein